MSTAQQPPAARPRPRPRPKPKAPPPVTTERASSHDAGPSSATGAAPSSPIAKPDDDDSLFIRKPRTAQQWQKLAEIEKKSKAKSIAIDISSDEDASPKARRYKKKSKPLPSWTNGKFKDLIASSSEEDSDSDDAHRANDNTPNGRHDKAAGKRKRDRSRSKSITPPPPLALHQIQHARNLVRQTLESTPRAASPTWAPDDSFDASLDPELAKIAQAIRTAPHTTNAEREGGGPEVVTIKVKWKLHPLDVAARPEVWIFKMKRHDNFKQVFEETADMASVLSESLVVLHDGSRVFPSASPHGLHIWAEAELEACDKNTHEYIRTHRHQRDPSPSFAADDEAGGSNSRLGTQDISDSDAESQSQGDKFKLILRSSQTKKDITLTVRPTTTCGAIVKAFLKSAGLTDKYKLTPKKGKKGVPKLSVDGDTMEPGDAIGDADLEDGDMVEVVGF